MTIYIVSRGFLYKNFFQKQEPIREPIDLLKSSSNSIFKNHWHLGSDEKTTYLCITLNDDVIEIPILAIFSEAKVFIQKFGLKQFMDGIGGL